ncbi:MAG: hypothetical protein B6I25_07860 [Planctomycetales bacterium 4572_13]|nr:MAG: hypothetical protein B6I25_07860 [Planctomycetales bacterium 4572_13]
MPKIQSSSQEFYKTNSIKLFLLICLTVCRIDVMKSVQTKKTVIDLLRGVFPALAGSYGVRRIALFGSFAKGTPQPESDVDLLVELDRPLGLRFVDMADFLEETLGRKVDILTPDGLADIRLPHISKTITETMEYVCPA